MEALYIILVLLLFAITGFIFGCIAARKSRKTHGTFVIDLTDPMKDIYRLEIDDISGLVELDQVILKVDKRFPPQN